MRLMRNIIRQCIKCGRIYGEKKPYQDKGVTHGYCPKCFEEEMKELEGRIRAGERKNPREGTMYKYQSETIKNYRKIQEGTIAQKEMEIGLHSYEPLIVAMDSMLRYVKAFRKHYDGVLSEDAILGEAYLDCISGIRMLLNGQGAVAMERGMSGDTKDNGTIENLFWECMEEGGFKEEDL